MNGKFLSLFIILTSTLLLVWNIFLTDHAESSVQAIVNSQYMDERGLIRNYGKEADVQYLSESIGQYLEYLLIIGDKEAFELQAQMLKEHYLVEAGPDVYIKWQITKDISTNALVDDLRIIKALIKAAETFKEPSYEKLADRVKNTLQHRQFEQGVIADFYDWELHKRSSSLHLSYVDYPLLLLFYSVDKSMYRKIFEGASANQSYFYEVYNIQNGEYMSSDESIINMIDQFLIAIQYRNIFGEVPALFDKWVKAELDSRGKLFGRYQKEHLNPAVNYESISVYALGIIYFLASGDRQHAEQLYKLLIDQFASNREQDYEAMHFFDYMYANTAIAIYKKSQQ